MLDSNESNLIQHLLFGNPSKDRETNTEILNATVNYVLTNKRFVKDSFKNVTFDKMLRLTPPYSLVYRDL